MIYIDFKRFYISCGMLTILSLDCIIMMCIETHISMYKKYSFV
nr:MAG TPA: hypothetical protein [Caudoviricetes sp.]